MSLTSVQSREIVKRIESGDGFAESELVGQYEQSVRLLLLKRTGSPQLANDLCQDTFVITLKKLRACKLRNPGRLSAFIRQTALNICIDHFRMEKRYIYQDDGAISLHHPYRDHKARDIDGRAARLVLEDALDQLVMPRDREILRRFYLADEDKTRICGDLELSSPHFDRVLYRARQRMRVLINKENGLKTMLFGNCFTG